MQEPAVARHGFSDAVMVCPLPALLQLKYARVYPIVPVKLDGWSFVTLGQRRRIKRRSSEARAEADEPVDADADEEIDGHAPVHLEALVAERLGQVGNQR
jgi:hypothetical protein